MIEGLLIAAGPVILKELLKSALPFNMYANIGIFLACIYIYTLIVLTYRCKFKTKDKPDFSYTKAMKFVLPFLGWYAVRIALDYMPPNPITLQVGFLMNRIIIFYIFVYILYYQALRIAFDDCFEDSLIDKIRKFFSNLF